MKPPRIYLLLASLSLLLAGCIDKIETVLRDRLALATEKLDAVMHVVDQQTAKDYIKGWEDRFQKRKEELEDRQRKLEDNMQNEDKKLRKTWQDHYTYMQKCASAQTPPDKEHGDPPLELPKYYYFYTQEMVNLQKALAREKTRLEKLEKDYPEVKKVLDSLSKK